MTRYARGDDDAFAEVYDLAAPAIYTFLVRLCRDRVLAEDLTHDVFLKIHRARGMFRPGADVLPWAYTIARRLFLDDVRSRKHEPVSIESDQEDRPSDPGPAGEGATADELVDASRLADRIESVLAKLPENQATAFRLLKQEELSVAEAAAVLGATETSVKLRAHRAYEALRKALGEQWNPKNSDGRRAP